MIMVVTHLKIRVNIACILLHRNLNPTLQYYTFSLFLMANNHLHMYPLKTPLFPTHISNIYLQESDKQDNIPNFKQKKMHKMILEHKKYCIMIRIDKDSNLESTLHKSQYHWLKIFHCNFESNLDFLRHIYYFQRFSDK